MKKPHVESNKEKEIDIISFDYFYGNKNIGDETRPIILMLDEKSGMKWARVVPVKGVPDDGSLHFIIRDAVKELETWGYKKNTAQPQCVFKSDGEPAIRKFRDMVATAMGGKYP